MRKPACHGWISFRVEWQRHPPVWQWHGRLASTLSFSFKQHSLLLWTCFVTSEAYSGDWPPRVCRLTITGRMGALHYLHVYTLGQFAHRSFLHVKYKYMSPSYICFSISFVPSYINEFFEPKKLLYIKQNYANFVLQKGIFSNFLLIYSLSQCEWRSVGQGSMALICVECKKSGGRWLGGDQDANNSFNAGRFIGG